MPAPNLQQQVTEVPVQIVGGNQFGRYAKINDAQTWNMIVSDGWLVPYAGYKRVVDIDNNLVGRGLHTSTIGGFMLAVIGSQVIRISQSFQPIVVGNLSTSTGEVYMAENTAKQIAITDGRYVYIVDYSSSTAVLKTSAPGGAINFNAQFSNASPGYIAYQNGRFVMAINGTASWCLSGFNDGLTWPNDTQHVGGFTIKPDYVQACVPSPSGGNTLMVFGKTAVQFWQDVGAALFPYQLQSTSNIDYGCVNPATIATLNQYVVWLAINEQSGPVLMVATGKNVEAISTDGIDFKLGNLIDPENCTGFLFQQDGHIIYQFTFITDNLSYIYDFKSQMFFSVTDENMDYHIAREVVYFNNNYFFVRLNGGNVYRLDSTYTGADYGDGDIKQLPRIRIVPPFRLPSQRNYIARSLGFTIENGQPNAVTTTGGVPLGGTILATESGLWLAAEDGVLIDAESDVTTSPVYTTYSEAVDLSISRDGGVTFGSSSRLNMNPVGKRKSRFIWQRLGMANDITFQLRFSGFGRFVVGDGVAEIYQ